MPTLVRIPGPSVEMMAHWAKLDDGLFEQLLQDAIADLGMQILADPDPQIRILAGRDFPKIKRLIEERWRGAYELAKREAAGITPS
jgi:hypothetical protein